MDPEQRIGGPNGLLRHLVAIGDVNSLVSGSLPESNLRHGIGLCSNRTIIELIIEGNAQEALATSLNKFQALGASYGNDHQHTLNSLANLHEHAVLANDSKLVTQAMVEQLESFAFNTNLAFGHFRMRVLSRLCEFSAHFGAKRPELKVIATESLECLHRIYPLANINEESKTYCARVSLVSAAHIAHWTMREGRADWRGLDHMASCAHERLAVFGKERSDFYMGLYELRRDNIESAIRLFNQIAPDISVAHIDIDLVIAALESPISALLEKQRLQDAQQRIEKISVLLSQPETIGNFAKLRERMIVYSEKLAGAELNF